MCPLCPQDVLNNLGSSELDEDDLMLDLDLSDDQRQRHGMDTPNPFNSKSTGFIPNGTLFLT